jgi:hypothetical protein
MKIFESKPQEYQVDISILAKVLKRQNNLPKLGRWNLPKRSRIETLFLKTMPIEISHVKICMYSQEIKLKNLIFYIHSWHIAKNG